MSVKVRINSNEFLQDAMSAVDKKARKRFVECGPEIGETFVHICTPFVPWETGTLAGSGRANMEGNSIRVSWTRTVNGFDVAHAQYYGDYNHTPPRTGRWAETAMDYEGTTFTRRCIKILNGK